MIKLTLTVAVVVMTLLHTNTVASEKKIHPVTIDLTEDPLQHHHYAFMNEKRSVLVTAGGIPMRAKTGYTAVLELNSRYRGFVVGGEFLEYNDPDPFNNCSMGTVMFFMKDNGDVVEFCGGSSPDEIPLLTGNADVEVKSGNSASPKSISFKLLLSGRVLKSMEPSGVCREGFFDCNNRYCVADGFRCNGYNDCGNNEDEFACPTTAPTTVV